MSRRANVGRALTLVVVAVAMGAWSLDWRDKSDALLDRAAARLERSAMLEPVQAEERPLTPTDVALYVNARSEDYGRRMLAVLESHYHGERPPVPQGKDYLSRAVLQKIQAQALGLISDAGNAGSSEELGRIRSRADALFPSGVAALD